MISYDDALKFVLDSVRTLDSEAVPLKLLAGRRLAAPLKAPIDLPGFDSSAVDGFAVRVADVENASKDAPVELPVVRDIQAGELPSGALSAGTAQRVMTGAIIPDGTEAMIMREHTIESPEKTTIIQPVKPGENIRRRGEEFRKGGIALPAGAQLNPAGVALVASLGYTEAEVVRLPRVAIITTGDEVVMPGRELQPGQLYNSNTWGLWSALREMGIEPVIVEHVEDSLGSTRSKIERAMAAADIVLSTGGVSMGDSDYVKDALREIGAEILFAWVAVKPGKPICFAKYGGKDTSQPGLFFGCPGNPVSVLLSFHFFAKPALRKLGGDPEIEPLRLTAAMRSDIYKKRGRHEHVRGGLYEHDGQLLAEPTKGQFSHMLGGLAIANCIIHFPAELEALREGDRVQVELINQ